MEDPADLRLQAVGWRVLAEFYGEGGKAMLDTARFLEDRAAELERAAAERKRA